MPTAKKYGVGRCSIGPWRHSKQNIQRPDLLRPSPWTAALRPRKQYSRAPDRYDLRYSDPREKQPPPDADKKTNAMGSRTGPRAKKREQGGGGNPCPCGTFGTSPAEQALVPKASRDTSPRTFANYMSTSPTYWTPFSPPWRWPIRILGILTLSGAFPVLLSGDYRQAIFPSLFGIYFLWTSFRTPILKTLSRGDILLRRISIASLIVIILGLLWVIWTSLPRP